MIEKSKNSVKWYHIALIIVAIANLYWMVTMERLYSTIDKIQVNIKEISKDVSSIQIDLGSLKTKTSYIERDVKDLKNNQKGKP